MTYNENNLNTNEDNLTGKELLEILENDRSTISVSKLLKYKRRLRCLIEEGLYKNSEI